MHARRSVLLIETRPAPFGLDAKKGSESGHGRRRRSTRPAAPLPGMGMKAILA
jgi:hypothetical protein